MSEPGLVTRLCACGCGASLDGRSPRARYLSDAHRARGWKEATGYTHPGRSSRQNGRNGALLTNAQQGPPHRPGKQVAYGRALDAGVRIAQMARLDPTASPEVIARQEMTRALPDRQRADLARRLGRKASAMRAADEVAVCVVATRQRQALAVGSLGYSSSPTALTASAWSKCHSTRVTRPERRVKIPVTLEEVRSPLPCPTPPQSCRRTTRPSGNAKTSRTSTCLLYTSPSPRDRG